MYEVEITGWFAAAHQLRLRDGELEPLHGHNWRVSATFAGPKLNDIGVLADFTELQPRLNAILAEFHDRLLNDLPAFADLNPSAENVARVIAERLSVGLDEGVRLACVAVEESPGCTARHRPGFDGAPPR